MTYLDSTLHTIENPDTKTRGDIDVAAIPSIFQMLMRAALVLMARFARARGPKTRNALILTLSLLLALHGGTSEEKQAFFERLVAKHKDIQKRLYARYRVWRQRKCWMWGGGFRAGILTAFQSVSVKTWDALTFDALIPD